MSKKPEERLWVAENGSIYVAEYDTIRSEFPGQKRSIPVRVSIAFNVGQVLAEHIVETHNAHISWKLEKEGDFKFHDYGPRGNPWPFMTPIALGPSEAEIESYKFIEHF